MKLTQREIEILAALQYKADLPLSDVARMTGHREHTVRYTVESLVERGIISRRTYINIYPLGYFKEAFFFSLTPDSRKFRGPLLDFLIKSPQIGYVAELGGEYQYKVDICGRTLDEISWFLNELYEQFGEILQGKSHAILVQLADFPTKIIRRRRGSGEALTMGVRDHRMEIDEIDHRILCALSTVGNSSHRELARKLGISNSTLEYRIKRMKQNKVVLGARYLIDTSQLNMQSFFHLVYVKGFSRSLRDKLYEYCKRHPHVDYFVQCMANWDFEIGTTVERAQDVVVFTQGLYESFGESILNVFSLPLFSVMKVSNYPFDDKSFSGRVAAANPIPDT